MRQTGFDMISSQRTDVKISADCKMVRFLERIRIGMFSLPVVAVLGAMATPALFLASSGTAVAQSSCQIDFGILQKQRVAQIQALNREAKRRKGKLDPVTACSKLRNLAAIERKMVKYMTENKSWCGIPDGPIQQMTTSSKRTGATAGQACKAASNFRRAKALARRQQQQQSQGLAAQRPKLPSGPL
jgi:hypothetical protein